MEVAPQRTQKLYVGGRTDGLDPTLEYIVILRFLSLEVKHINAINGLWTG